MSGNTFTYSLIAEQVLPITAPSIDGGQLKLLLLTLKLRTATALEFAAQTKVDYFLKNS
ncbi:hypothetical protein U9R62_15305 [Cylindrospermopsis raciborskii DSH]|uniref:hypothetical protein n=1 Tax=Cylindrospermopsis raciborskii TaxID=77022 RepID=UPI002EDAE14E